MFLWGDQACLLSKYHKKSKSLMWRMSHGEAYKRKKNFESYEL